MVLGKWLDHTLAVEDILPVVRRLAEWEKVDLENIDIEGMVTQTHEEGLGHVARLIHRVYQWSEKINPHHMGSFLTAFVENDLHRAVSNADRTNVRSLCVYVKYFYNYAPMDWRKQRNRKAE